MYTLPNTGGDPNVIANSVMHDGIKWINTQYFRDQAIAYMKNESYTNAPYGSREYREYWETQKNN
jgi:hypothetical protein